jgi:PIN domain nuclease of toxin-antitoxin system
MRLLLDTHTFLWWIADDHRLSETAVKVISEADNQLFLSAASGWEIAIKAKLGKLDIDGDVTSFIIEQMRLNSIDQLPVMLSHALHVSTLEALHRDPFDRLLIAQAQLERMPILTADQYVTMYPVETVW